MLEGKVYGFSLTNSDYYTCQRNDWKILQVCTCKCLQLSDHVPPLHGHRTLLPVALAATRTTLIHSIFCLKHTLLSGDTGQSLRGCPKAVKLEKSVPESCWRPLFQVCLSRPKILVLLPAPPPVVLSGWGLDILRKDWGDTCDSLPCQEVVWCLAFSCWMKSIQRCLLGASLA